MSIWKESRGKKEKWSRDGKYLGKAGWWNFIHDHLDHLFRLCKSSGKPCKIVCFVDSYGRFRYGIMSFANWWDDIKIGTVKRMENGLEFICTRIFEVNK